MVYYNAIFDGQVQRIPIKDILYITLDKYGSTIVLDKRLYEKEDAKYIKSREKLNSIYMRLNKYGFEYAHNSYIVNFKHIMSIFKQEIVLDDKTILNISRSKKKNFDEKFAEFLNVNFNRKRGEKI